MAWALAQLVVWDREKVTDMDLAAEETPGAEIGMKVVVDRAVAVAETRIGFTVAKT